MIETVGDLLELVDFPRLDAGQSLQASRKAHSGQFADLNELLSRAKRAQTDGQLEKAKRLAEPSTARRPSGRTPVLDQLRSPICFWEGGGVG
jgi:hypothetical protein